jgi:ribosomal protein S18 acetylase RimI-like enzyme
MVCTMVEYRHNPELCNRHLNDLFATSWIGHTERDFRPVLKQSLGYIGAFETDQLIGFVNVAWDGGSHAFILDTTVHPNFQRRGVGTQLVKEASKLARCAKIEWLHVDCNQELARFYFNSCGFVTTTAGLMKLI